MALPIELDCSLDCRARCYPQPACVCDNYDAKSCAGLVSHKGASCPGFGVRNSDSYLGNRAPRGIGNRTHDGGLLARSGEREQKEEHAQQKERAFF